MRTHIPQTVARLAHMVYVAGSAQGGASTRSYPEMVLLDLLFPTRTRGEERSGMAAAAPDRNRGR